MRDLEALSLSGVYLERISSIVEDGLAEVEGDVLRLTGPGKLVYSELMAHFFSDLQRRLYQRLTERLSRQVGAIDAQEWAAGEDRVRHMGAFNALPGASTRRPVRTPR
jgi:oxygen-independent coproporphyrinogen-3 oxidase